MPQRFDVSLRKNIGAEDFMEQTKSTAPRLLYGGITAREPELAEMCEAAEACFVHEQEFAAPNCSVCSQAGSIPGNAEHRWIQPIIRHAGEHVSVMMLDADEARCRF